MTCRRSRRLLCRRRQAHYAQKMGDLLCFGNLTDFFPIRILWLVVADAWQCLLLQFIQ